MCVCLCVYVCLYTHDTMGTCMCVRRNMCLYVYIQVETKGKLWVSLLFFLRHHPLWFFVVGLVELLSGLE